MSLELTDKDLIKFDEVYNEIDEEDKRKWDTVQPLKNLIILGDRNIEIVGEGTFQMTEWAIQQLSRLVGIRWCKWFDKNIDLDQVNEELQLRFKNKGDMKLRLERGTNRYNFLRGIVSKTYRPIDDLKVFSHLSNHPWDNLSIIKNKSWTSDRTSNYMVVGPSMDMKTKGRRDIVYSGFRIRNSEVGFCSLTIDSFVFRLVCTNGLILKTGNSRILEQQHRNIKPEVLGEKLERAFNYVVKECPKYLDNIRTAKSVRVEDVNGYVSNLIGKNVTNGFRKQLLSAFEEDPDYSVYGIAQAISHAAKNYNAEQRFEYERLAGSLVSYPTI